jgi:hypothetical protein
MLKSNINYISKMQYAIFKKETLQSKSECESRPTDKYPNDFFRNDLFLTSLHILTDSGPMLDLITCTFQEKFIHLP